MGRSTYKNLNPDVHPTFAEFFRWAVLDRFAGRRRKSPDSSPIPICKNIDIGTAADESVTWLGHSTCLISLGGQWVLTDPVFAENLGGLVPRNVPVVIPPEKLPDISTVLISHNHRDHLDKRSIADIESRGNPKYIVPLEVEKILESWGISRSRIVSLSWWDEHSSDGSLHITAVPAQHWSRRGLNDLNTSWWCGYVLESEKSVIYFAGDSGYSDQFAEIGGRFSKVDVALLPIGSYDPSWFMSPQHMNPAEALQAMLDVGASRLLPIHWGTYKLSDEPLDEPPVLLRSSVLEKGIGVERIAVPAVGETIRL